MLYSKLFPKTLKQSPTGAESKNHQLLVRAGFIHQEMAGVYSYLPLGWRVLDKISDIVREEMNAIGAQEILMSALEPKESWVKSGRWQSFDALFQLKSRHGADYALGPTHEEIVYPLVAEHVSSYKDLPVYLYQIQTKFRDEPRAKSGLLRGREFLMKDLYSFHFSDEDRDEYYEEVRLAYLKIYKRVGLPIVETKASGGTFSDLSQEFQTLTPNGEDTVMVCISCQAAINKELAENTTCSLCGGKLEEKKAIEVGNIFPLKTSFAESFNLKFTDSDGQKKLVSAGCYGIGISRVMGAVVEVFHDEKGIVWPENVAPFKAHLVGLDLDDKKVWDNAMRVYKLLQAEGIEVLFDDRADVSAGAKFADADLIGIPYRIVISKKTKDELEVKKRSERETKFVNFEKLLEKLKDSH